jgi:thiol:disulfide interchange protein
VRAALDGLAGIARVEVDLNRDAFTVCYVASELSLDTIKETISDLGFKPRLIGKNEAVAPSQPKLSADVPAPIARALAKARESKRLLFVDFYAEWCVPCIVLEETIFPDPGVQKALEAYVFVKVDTDRFPSAGEFFAVAAMPTLLVLDGQGKELHRLVGMTDARELATLLGRLAGSASSGRTGR